jgi:cobalt-zinc-cadmium efflux system outer membrane protein
MARKGVFVRPTVLLAIVAAAAVAVTTAHAQPVSPSPPGDVPAITEAELLAGLDEGHPALERLAADVDAARAEVVAAGIRPDPSIVLDREELFPDGGLATSYARVELPIDLSGRRARRVGAARAAVDAVAADTGAARWRLTIAALRTFTAAAYARLEVELLRAERAALVRVVEIVRKRVEAGAASGYDLQRIELELASYDDLAAGAETRLMEARTELATLVGTGPPQVDAASALELPAPSTVATPREVLADHDDYRAARMRARSAEQLASEARRGWVPAIGLSAGAMSQDTGDATAYGYTVGLSFSLPVFDRGRATAARAQAARRAAAADARLLETTLPARLRARQESLARHIAQAEQLRAGQLARLTRLLTSAETAYREGSSSVVELLDAYATARNRRLRDLELRRDARLAELELWLVLGRRP